MNISAKHRFCLVPRLSGLGGMVSFQGKLVRGFEKRGYSVTYDLNDLPYTAVLVIGGYKDLPGLWRAARRGIPVIQRLNGMNWIHRLRRTGLRHYLRAEYGNFILAQIRGKIASRIVYQSQFSQRWWESVRGAAPVPSRIVYNGVDLEIFSNQGDHDRPQDRFQVLLVEGTLGGGYEMGLKSAVDLVEGLQERLPEPVELKVTGKVAPALQESWKNQSKAPLSFTGQIPHAEIPRLDRSAHLLYSADIHAACPNSVIEALSCGLPVAAYDTGALAELVQGDAGRVVPYGGDPWRLEPPDLPALVEAAAEILKEQERFRQAARRRAETAFGLDAMVEGYLEALLV
jgi:glycosyltransferase involved in cell wall biosynthesis